jgi:hypothetical protein
MDARGSGVFDLVIEAPAAPDSRALVRTQAYPAVDSVKEHVNMRHTNIVAPRFMLAVMCAGWWLISPAPAQAHCDSLAGPVVTEARAALQKGDVTPLLKWVRNADEAEVKSAFAKTVAVRALGAEARDLADRYFLETLVRLHRAGEGAPYTGLKDGPADPVAAMTDKALADGSADELIRKVSSHMAAAIGEQFTKVAEAKKHKDASVDAGRRFVEAYVSYTHFVEGIHTAITSSGAHGHAGEAAHAATDAAKHDAPRK